MRSCSILSVVALLTSACAADEPADVATDAAPAADSEMSSDAAVGPAGTDPLLDPSFGEDGLFMPPRLADAYVDGFAAAPDGGAWLSGSFTGETSGFLCRVSASGAFVETFGDGGCATAPDGRVHGAVASGDDVLGYGQTGATGKVGTIWRYRADGTRDPLFGDNGRVTIRSSAPGTFIGQLAIEPNGTLLAVGFAGEADLFGGAGRAFVVRLTPDGQILQQITFAGPDTAITTAGHVAALPDGSVVVAGSYQLPEGYFQDFLATFANSITDVPTRLELDLAGNAHVTPLLDVLVHRLDAIGRFHLDGTPMTTFGGDGVITPGYGDYEYWRCALPLPGGALLVAGDTTTETPGDRELIPAQPLLRRFDAAGVPDAEFGEDGRHLIRLLGPGQITHVVASGDNAILMLGLQTDEDGLHRWPFVARLGK